MRRTLVALAVAAGTALVASAPAAAQQVPVTARPGVDATDASVALESEVLALVELGAFPAPVPQHLRRINATWRSSLDGLDHDSLVGWVVAADDDGASALDGLRRSGLRPTPALERALGPLSDRNIDALRAGRQIDVAAGDYDAALGQLAALEPTGAPPTPAKEAAGSATAARGSSAAADPSATLARTRTDTTGGTTPWWVWVLAGLAVSFGASILVGRRLRRVSEAHLPPPLPEDERGDEVARLLDAARRLGSSLAAPEVAGMAVEEARSLTNALAAAVVVTTTGAPVVAASTPGHTTGAPAVDERYVGTGVLGRVLASGHPERSVVVDAAFGPSALAVMAVPVVRSGRVTGALCVARDPSQPFGATAQDRLAKLAPLLAGALDAAERHDGVASLSLTDGLTELANRRRLDRDLPDALGPGRGPVGFLMIDVDHFKTYNDVNGHVAGDEALRLLAEVLASHVRPTDVVYRYGGEEFCVLLADATHDEAAGVAERIRAGVEAADFPGAASQPGGRVTVSVGLAVAEATDARDITQRADAALYLAKHGGRNRVEVAAVG